MCGCDGREYPDIQTACRFGVRAVTNGGCGQTVLEGVGGAYGEADALSVTYCGRDNNCPMGQNCCTLLGECYDSQSPYLCGEPPPGANRRCLQDSDCHPGNFCKALEPGCGPQQEGGCVSFSGECNVGELIPVCGCDGVNYTNPACAQAAGTNVAHEGSCGDADL